jgi:methionyl-tRNA formyltransferase
MKIVFMGTPEAATASLARLLDDGHELVAVYTQPDRPAGRGKKIGHSPVKQFALERGLPIFQPTKVRTEEAAATFRSHQADVAIVVAYGRILPESFLTAFKGGAINVHFSLLPKYRGAAPVNWAIVNGEMETGVTIMKMDAGLDTGDILLQRSTSIVPAETAVDLMRRLSVLGAELISEALLNFDRLIPRSQDDEEASYAPMMTKEDGRIDWSMPAVDIANRVRGFQPFPTCYTFLNGKRLTIWKAETEADGSSADLPGKVVVANGNHLTIGCGGGSRLLVKEIQPEGKQRMTARDFLNGSKVSVGDVLQGKREEIGAD